MQPEPVHMQSFPICARLQEEHGFSGVLAEHVPGILPAYKEVLSGAIERWGGEFIWEDIVEKLCAQEWQLWITPNSCLITGVRPQGRFDICALICYGGNLDDVMACLPGVMEWAASVGCRRIVVEGRKGWGRALAEFGAELKYYVYTIDLD